MTLVSLADACRQLSIDPKTLRRWLASAPFTLQPQPQDARRTGLTQEQLHWLATAHHRSLPNLPQELPQPAPAPGGERAPLPDDLYEMLVALRTLASQLAPLQEQVVALSHLLQQSRQEPARPSAPATPPTKARRVSTPAPLARSARPATSASTKQSRKPVQVIAHVEYVSEGHYVVICPKQGILPFEPESPQWFAWLAEQSSFRFVGQAGTFSAHHEWRTPRGAWRAHRHIRNRGYHLRLAPTQVLTIAVLEQAAATLQAHLR